MAWLDKALVTLGFASRVAVRISLDTRCPRLAEKKAKARLGRMSLLVESSTRGRDECVEGYPLDKEPGMECALLFFQRIGNYLAHLATARLPARTVGVFHEVKLYVADRIGGCRHLGKHSFLTCIYGHSGF